ncbi:hypothetical protein CXB51_032173 [Gossypium anomalum]|uniref:Alanine--tRNA ligase n=1 Tax=Gossypium anomalum TaxID=47600 RepID=A0A8J5Y2U2_9ROSI|nr:hypothetical protein CXB51_032173 [Gossypium anomalum]
MKASILSNNISGVLGYPRLLAAQRIRICRVFGCLFNITSNPPSCTFSSLAAMSGVDAPEMERPAKKVRDTFINFSKARIMLIGIPVPSFPTMIPLSCLLMPFICILPELCDTEYESVQADLFGDRRSQHCYEQAHNGVQHSKMYRAGGKHNDLDDVGKETYHHTLFEMLGHWSFGNYFKKDAIEWAWELLTKVYSLPTDRIYATYFGGDDEAGLPPDNEAKDIWLKFLPPECVLPFGCKDNFWEMGDTGPCGPCTEIHYDRVGNRNAASLVNNDDPSCIEIWNLVFIQFNRESDGSLKPLPAKHVDTGMGFERLTSVLQNKMSNYDTDVFFPIFDVIQQFCLFLEIIFFFKCSIGRKKQKGDSAHPYSGKVGPGDIDKVDMAYRVVGDHIRTLSFAIADGASPGNEEHEYVLRRILRRAVCYGSELLKAPEGFFSKLVKIVVEVMGDVFPELKQHEVRIGDIIAAEEASFGMTLVKGIEKFKKAAQDVQGRILSGQDAFILWDTYGFPLDLTQLMAEERGLTVDVEGFNNAMDEAREKSRSARNKQAGDAIVVDADATSALHRKGDHESVIKAIYTSSEFVESVSAGDDVGIVLESTSFYAEQGGQSGTVNDNGGTQKEIFFKTRGGDANGNGVTDVYCSKWIFDTGSLDGSFGSFQVDYDRRRLIAPNHTCTHMLNFALREVLGGHFDQKGSIVLPEKLRFDFSHEKLSIVNEQIKAELDVYSKEATLAEAKRINGLRAVFGEKLCYALNVGYPDPVRVVAIGRKVEDLLANPENREWSSISSELCGGTRITNTREAKAFALLSEEGIAKGVRRLTAVTTESALKAMELGDLLLQEVDDASKMEVNLLEKLCDILKCLVASLKRSVDSASIPAARKADIRAKIAQLQKAVTIAIEMVELAAKEGKTFCISWIDVGLDAAALREAVSKVIQQKEMPVMVFSIDETTNKAVVYAGVPEKSESIKRLEVSDWLTKALGPLKGKCGRSKGGLATGQGTDASRVNEAIDLATSFASMKLR